jgi:HD-GYP domain-containing protein (c-di-GMP phosphodiesterase class II)
VDKPEHLIPFLDGADDGPDMSRFNLPVPRHRFNYGEIYNLLVDKGTLTPEERYAMQEHSVQTILMLEQLPFPPHLSKVVEYACNHHEKMNGSGYPQGLSGNEMSIWARVLAIADIFEALTAADRPYKESMSVETALEIISSMCESGELDTNLYTLFKNTDVITTYLQLYSIE